MARIKTKQARAAKRERKDTKPDLGASMNFKVGVSLFVVLLLVCWSFEIQALYSRIVRQRHGVVRKIDENAKWIGVQVEGSTDSLDIDIADVPNGEGSTKLEFGTHVTVTYREALWGRRHGLTIKVFPAKETQTEGHVSG